MELKSHYEILKNSLEDLIKLYHTLYELMQQEKEHLVLSQISEINELNRSKESFLIRIREVEEQRLLAAQSLAVLHKLNPGTVKIRELILKIGGEPADKLRQLQEVLDMQLEQIKELNRSNDLLVQNALRHINGALHELRGGVPQEKLTYERMGQKKASTLAGRLVSKQV